MARQDRRLSLSGVGHLLDRCDLLDVLEQSARLRCDVLVELKGGKRFVDRAREVVTDDGQEWAVFRAHGRVSVADIRFCGPLTPAEPTYRGKT